MIDGNYYLLKVDRAPERQRQAAMEIAEALLLDPPRTRQVDIINDILLTLGLSKSNCLVYLDTLLLQYKVITLDEFYHRTRNVLLGVDKRYDIADEVSIADGIHLGYWDNPNDERILEYYMHGFDESMWED